MYCNNEFIGSLITTFTYNEALKPIKSLSKAISGDTNTIFSTYDSSVEINKTLGYESVTSLGYEQNNTLMYKVVFKNDTLNKEYSINSIEYNGGEISSYYEGIYNSNHQIIKEISINYSSENETQKNITTYTYNNNVLIKTEYKYFYIIYDVEELINVQIDEFDNKGNNILHSYAEYKNNTISALETTEISYNELNAIIKEITTYYEGSSLVIANDTIEYFYDEN